MPERDIEASKEVLKRQRERKRERERERRETRRAHVAWMETPSFLLGVRLALAGAYTIAHGRSLCSVIREGTGNYMVMKCSWAHRNGGGSTGKTIRFYSENLIDRCRATATATTTTTTTTTTTLLPVTCVHTPRQKPHEQPPSAQTLHSAECSSWYLIST